MTSGTRFSGFSIPRAKSRPPLLTHIGGLLRSWNSKRPVRPPPLQLRYEVVRTRECSGRVVVVELRSVCISCVCFWARSSRTNIRSSCIGAVTTCTHRYARNESALSCLFVCMASHLPRPATSHCPRLAAFEPRTSFSLSQLSCISTLIFPDNALQDQHMLMLLQTIPRQSFR